MPEDPRPEEPRPQPPPVTARMQRLRELIAEGEYPDRDELAKRIVDATFPVT